MILVLLVRVAIAFVIGPSLTVAVQEHAIGHDANHIVCDHCSITRSSGSLRDHHGIMLVHWIVRSVGRGGAILLGTAAAFSTFATTASALV